ncbi:DoxX family protein [Roseomonas populi]|uniref:DoxX family protein n=1 Tax=Roseomonas populi TaxID=3121582 RepID=A0ABT1XF16_9PROT|nr:DoxX family protein [Roseomonas pecuniae]MCR0985742.1 DoxX family protein [Roseomonas pecuniae]
MPGSVPEAAIAILLAAAMAIGAGLNLVGPGFVREEFRRWGYPAALRIAAGLTEGAAAVLLVSSSTRSAGALLALAVLASVIITLARDRAWLRCEYPTVLAIMAVLILTR